MEMFFVSSAADMNFDHCLCETEDVFVCGWCFFSLLFCHDQITIWMHLNAAYVEMFFSTIVVAEKSKS